MSNTQLPDNVRQFLARDHGLLIGGSWQRANGGSIDVIDPANGQQIASIGNASRDDVNAAVAAARAGFSSDAWRSTSPSERGAILRRTAALIEALSLIHI